MDEENEEARQELDGDVYNNTVNQIETQDDYEEEKYEHINMHEEDENNFSHENEKYEAGDKVYSVSIHFIFIIF